MAECLLSLLTLLPLTLPLATPEEARSHDGARSLVARFHSYGSGDFEYPDNANIPLEGLRHKESLHVHASLSCGAPSLSDADSSASPRDLYRRRESAPAFDQDPTRSATRVTASRVCNPNGYMIRCDALSRDLLAAQTS